MVITLIACSLADGDKLRPFGGSLWTSRRPPTASTRLRKLVRSNPERITARPWPLLVISTTSCLFGCAGVCQMRFGQGECLAYGFFETICIVAYSRACSIANLVAATVMPIT